MRNNWYDRIIIKHKKKAEISAIFLLCFALTYSLWRFGLGYSFEWVEISPISQPSFLHRTLYSALVFRTLGYFLFAAGFYKALHTILVKIFRLRGLYDLIKKYLWLFLMWVMYIDIIPPIIDFINFILCIGYNIVNLLLYLSPPVGIAFILTLLGVSIRKNYKIFKVAG